MCHEGAAAPCAAIWMPQMRAVRASGIQIRRYPHCGAAPRNAPVVG